MVKYNRNPPYIDMLQKAWLKQPSTLLFVETAHFFLLTTVYVALYVIKDL